LNERFRLGFEDSGLEDVMEENESIKVDDEALKLTALPDEAIDMEAPVSNIEDQMVTEPDYSRPLVGDEIRTFDGKIAEDEIAADALNHQYLLEKIDLLLEKLNLDA
jgi:ankyrin repeat/BTB/POZ domain-containing protein 1